MAPEELSAEVEIGVTVVWSAAIVVPSELSVSCVAITVAAVVLEVPV